MFNSIAVTVLASLFLVSMIDAAEEAPSPAATGIEGTIVVSPARPGPIRKDDGETVAPVGNTPFVVEAGDTAVATFTTDEAGRFQVALKPGNYSVELKDRPAVGRWRFEAVVVAGQMTKVYWTADSGMR
jgi:hypothetical protein